jgi:hypothetical protein
LLQSPTKYITETIKSGTGVICLPTRFDSRTPISDIEGIFRVTETQCQQYYIDNSLDWLEFIKKCYSLSCIDPHHNWLSVKGKKDTFLNWMLREDARNKASNPYQDTTKKCHFFKIDLTKFVNNVIITVTDSNKGKMLIVDGLHRAAALTIAAEEGTPFPKVRICECYGKNVNVIYPCDVHQL